MAQIINRGKKKYLVRVFLGRKPGQPRYLDKMIHGDWKSAKKYADETETKRDLGLLNQPEPEPAEPEPTVGEFLDDWFQHFKRGTVRESTATSYKDVLDLYIVPHLGSVKVSALTTRSIQEVYNALADKHSPRTVAYAHSLLREALDQAARDGLLPSNPAVSTKRVKRKKPKIQSLSPEEADRFIKAAKTDQHCVLFWLALATGLRPEEYLALRWADLDLEKCAVAVSRTLYCPRGGGWRFEDVKSDSGLRTVEFDSELGSALSEHKRGQLAHRLRRGKKYHNHDLVFTARNGEPLNMRHLTLRHLEPIFKSAKIDGKINLYRLRHSFVTLSLLAGIDPKTVSAAAGHSSVAFTLDNYAHALPKLRKDAVKKLGRILKFRVG